MSTDQRNEKQQQEEEEVLRPAPPFRPTVFLFRMLALIFLAEAAFLGFAFVKCSEPVISKPTIGVKDRCPDIGERSETLFLAAITTTLSLLSAGNTLKP